MVNVDMRNYPHVAVEGEGKMPTPRKGESQKEFVSRCIPIVTKEGTAESQDQAIAICYSMYRQYKKKQKK